MGQLPQNKNASIFKIKYLHLNLVAQSGLEPELSEPESGMLPLHHWAILRVQKYNIFSNHQSKILKNVLKIIFMSTPKDISLIYRKLSFNFAGITSSM